MPSCGHRKVGEISKSQKLKGRKEEERRKKGGGGADKDEREWAVISAK
jgi:hypothetical protein